MMRTCSLDLAGRIGKVFRGTWPQCDTLRCYYYCQASCTVFWKGKILCYCNDSG